MEKNSHHSSIMLIGPKDVHFRAGGRSEQLCWIAGLFNIQHKIIQRGEMDLGQDINVDIELLGAAG